VGLFVGVEHTDTGLQQKAAQDSFVARTLTAQTKTAYGKSGTQFSQNDEGQPDFIGEFEPFDKRRRCRGKGRYSDWCRAASLSHLFVDGVLRG